MLSLCCDETSNDVGNGVGVDVSDPLDLSPKWAARKSTKNSESIHLLLL